MLLSVLRGENITTRLSLEQIGALFGALVKYGFSPREVIRRGHCIYDIIHSVAINNPLDSFALVCKYGLETLAVEISRYLVAIPLYNLSDQNCLDMGPLYLRRLCFLQIGRTERLKALLRDVPVGHAPTRMCDAIDQRRNLQAAWKQATSEIVQDMAPDTAGPFPRGLTSLIIYL